MRFGFGVSGGSDWVKGDSRRVTRWVEPSMETFTACQQKVQFWTEIWEKPGGIEEANDGSWDYWILKIMLLMLLSSFSRCGWRDIDTYP